MESSSFSYHRANKPEKCCKYFCTLNVKIKINKSHGSESRKDLKARGKKNEEISRLKKTEEGRERERVDFLLELSSLT